LNGFWDVIVIFFVKVTSFNSIEWILYNVEYENESRDDYLSIPLNGFASRA